MASSSRVPMVEPITLSWRKKMLVSMASSRFGPDVVPRDHDAAAGPQRADRVLPGRPADRLHHGVDLDRQPLARLEHVVRTELERLGALRLVAAGREDLQAAGPAQRDERGRDATAGTLDQDGVTGLEPALGEQHPVGGQPGGRKAGGLLERQRRRLRHDVAPRYDDPLRERALVTLREQRPARVERLVTRPVGAADDRVHDDLVAVLVVDRRRRSRGSSAALPP